MTPIYGLRQLLLNQASVTAITNTVEPIPAPESLARYPLITYQQISSKHDYSLQGPISVDQTRIAYNCFSKSYVQARQLADAVSQTFDGFKGILPDGTEAYTEVISQDDGYDTGNQLSKVTVQIYCWA